MVEAVSVRPKIERRDTHLRRERIVRAAVELYAGEGLDVTFDKIADRALVGRTTLHRYFPDRDALMAAVMQHYFDDLTEKLRQWGDRDDAFFLCLKAIAKLNIESRGFEKLASMRMDTPTMTKHAHDGLENVMKAPLLRAKKAGLISSNFELGNALLVSHMLAAGGLAETTGDTKMGIERAMRLLMPALTQGAKKQLRPGSGRKNQN
jgi:AcrR family transcriptional regulator